MTEEQRKLLRKDEQELIHLVQRHGDITAIDFWIGRLAEARADHKALLVRAEAFCKRTCCYCDAGDPFDYKIMAHRHPGTVSSWICQNVEARRLLAELFPEGQ